MRKGEREKTGKKWQLRARVMSGVLSTTCTIKTHVDANTKHVALAINMAAGFLLARSG